MAESFLANQIAVTNEPVDKPVWQYGYGEYDAKSDRLARFKALPHFTGSAWQGGAKLPDNKLGWVTLNAEGGHTGNDAAHAAVRRWRAPRDGTVKISGQLRHETDKGDGIRGRLISSGGGKLGEWVLHNSRATTNVERVEVKRGDTIDFAVDLNGNLDSDSFTWAPRIRYVESSSGYSGAWNAKNDFAGPAKQRQPLNAWERYAQALLLSNEMMFVD
jgi:hypothetical protein